MIADSKRQMIQSRLTRHMRDIRCANMETYFQEIRTDKTGAIKNALISVLTTNVSSFFREKHHFDAFAEKILPSVLRKARSGKKVRIWSARRDLDLCALIAELIVRRLRV